MRKLLICALVAGLAFASASAANAKPAKGQKAPAAAELAHAYDLGPVWDISYVETKTPAAFEDYIRYLAGPYTALNNEYKRLGDVLDFKVLNVQNPRDGEADLMLIVVYKNMAVFDRAIADNDAIAAKVFGSVSQSDAAAGARESIRKLRGDILTRELILKSPPKP